MLQAEVLHIPITEEWRTGGYSLCRPNATTSLHLQNLCQMHCLSLRNAVPKPLWLQLLVDCVYHPTMDLGIAVVELENDGCRWRFEDGAGAAFLKVQVLPAQLVLE
ncbi:TPA: hypothetical protein ACH3X1_002892 [Trebouxia sp. C0004]